MKIAVKDNNIVNYLNTSKNINNYIGSNELYKSNSMLNSIAFVFENESIGQSDELGNILLKDFFSSLCASFEKPQYIVFTKKAARLCIKDSCIAQQLSFLKSCEVSILVDYSSILYYNLKKEIIFGSHISMNELVEIFMTVKKVIHL